MLVQTPSDAPLNLPRAQATESLLNSVGAGFFTSVGTPFVAGRDLRNDETDADACILNQAAAAKFFPKANPLGRMLRHVPYSTLRVFDYKHPHPTRCVE
jgi:hypothetical protein